MLGFMGIMLYIHTGYTGAQNTSRILFHYKDKLLYTGTRWSIEIKSWLISLI